MKKTLFIAICVFFFTPHLMASSTSPLGIMGALDEEIAAIQKIMTNVKDSTIDNKKVYVGHINGYPVVLVKSGVGKVSAASTTQFLITKFGCKEIIFTGVAGAVNPKNRIGDIVIAKQLALHDYGIVSPTGKALWKSGALFGSTDVKDLWLFLDRSNIFRKLNSAKKLTRLSPVPSELVQAQYTPKIRVGRVVTGDEFIASEQKRIWLEQTFDADAVEMEGAAFAQVCLNEKIDCVVIRSISDLANETSHIDFQKFAAYAAENSAKLVQALLNSY